jgi:hypothetical protein
VARNHDFFALFDQVEQMAELVLGFEGTDLTNERTYQVKLALSSLSAEAVRREFLV